MAINFASSVVLARLLTPDDFGCIAMLMIFISLSKTFIDGGFGSALIQKKKPTKEDYSTIFYWNIALSLLLYIIIFLFAPYIASFYRIPLLTRVLRVQGIVLFFNALSIIQQNQLRKNLQFKQLSIIYVVSALLSLALAIVLACRGFGVWSLVAQQISISGLHALLFWIVGKWKPMLVFSFSSLKELFKFGSFMLFSSLVSTFAVEMQGLLVGRKFNAATLGLYNQAFRLEGSAATAASSVIDNVTFPVLSSVQDDKKAFISALKRFIQIPSYICCIMMTILIVIAKPVIILIYSSKWVECIPYFQVLCVGGVAVCLQGIAKNSLAAIGESKVIFKWNLIQRILTIVLCVLGIVIAGMKGLLWSGVAGTWAVYIINSFLISKYVGYSFYKQTMDILPSILISLVVGVIAYYGGALINAHMYVVAIVQALFCLLFYAIISRILKIEPFLYLKGIVISKISKAQSKG